MSTNITTCTVYVCHVMFISRAIHCSSVKRAVKYERLFMALEHRNTILHNYEQL